MGLLEDFLNEPESLEDRIWMMHNAGLAPSEIAEKLNVNEDAAREVVVARWREDKERVMDRRARM